MLQVSFILFGLIAAIHAAPQGLEARDVSTGVLSQLSLYEQYAAAAYCVNNNNSPGNKVTCAAGNCPTVEAATTVTSLEFQNSLITDVTGVVVVDSTNRNIVVSFRGSKSVRNYLTNVNFDTIPTDICDGCTVHQGFWKSWLEARPRIMAAVKDAAASNPGYAIISSGHSLGGAIATLCAANLRNDGYSVALYTYGAPQTGKQTFADYVSRQAGGNYRVTHTDDIVPKLPGLVFGYRHIGPEYFITSANNAPVTIRDIRVIPGQPLFAGNQATLTSSTDAHSWYFNGIAACSPEGFELKN